MKRIACLVSFVVVTITSLAQRSVDFASKYMACCNGDTLVKCVTIGPKMMEQLTKHHDANSNEYIDQAIQKLKSARIIISNVNGEDYYIKAENLLKRYPKRFRHDKDYHNAHAMGTFYQRMSKDGKVVELVMLHNDTVKNAMVIVNLTGDIDEEFTELLSKNLGNKNR